MFRVSSNMFLLPSPCINWHFCWRNSLQKQQLNFPKYTGFRSHGFIRKIQSKQHCKPTSPPPPQNKVMLRVLYSYEPNLNHPIPPSTILQGESREREGEVVFCAEFGGTRQQIGYCSCCCCYWNARALSQMKRPTTTGAKKRIKCSQGGEYKSFHGDSTRRFLGIRESFRYSSLSVATYNGSARD